MVLRLQTRKLHCEMRSQGSISPLDEHTHVIARSPCVADDPLVASWNQDGAHFIRRRRGGDNESTAMEVVVDEGNRAEARVRELERHKAGRALTRASLALVKVERSGGAAADRRQLEETLATTKARASEPWAERIAAAEAAARDARATVRGLAAERFDERASDASRRESKRGAVDRRGGKPV
jgi:hypothetical protein